MKHTLLLLLFVPHLVCGQFTYTLDASIPVKQGSNNLTMPWAGGLNAPQVNTMDLDGDGKEDLVLYDKVTNRFTTLLVRDGAYVHAPAYEGYFPSECNTFVQLRDFNCDGKKDLFTFGDIGLYVYRNITPAGQPPVWKKLSFYNSDSGLKSQVLLTRGFSNLINLLPGTNDLPHFGDMDGDGDLDILNMRFVSPSTAEYHKNFSMERYGTCDSLTFERQTQKWGDFEECSCGKIAFGGLTCAQIGGRMEAVEHTGGKSLLAYDLDHDGDQDLLYSEEQCSRIYYMENTGSAATPQLGNLANYPPSQAIAINLFPAAYMADVDFDGQVDLLSSPNLGSRSQLANNFQQSLWLYHNSGTNQVPNFTFTKSNFLQENMIELGENSTPALLDADRDGDEDLFISNYTSSDFRARVAYYENTGTRTTPSFEWVTDDFLNLSLYSFYNLKIHFADVDGNGTQDLAMVATSLVNNRTGVYYLPGSSSSSGAFGGQSLRSVNFTINPNETVHFSDLDSDGRTDILKGTYQGAVEYWRNTGSGYTLQNASYLGIGISTDRQNPAVALGDFNADGIEDLAMGDQNGIITIYSDHRSGTSTPLTNVLYDPLSKTYSGRNLGGVLVPAVAHLFGLDKPEIVVGNNAGGIMLLKNDNGQPVSDTPRLTLFPNPVPRGQSVSVLTDRPGSLSFYTLQGQPIGSTMIIPAHVVTAYPLQGISPGTYIARFSASGQSTSQQIIIP